MKFTIEQNWIDVLGMIWMPNCKATQQIMISRHDIENMTDDYGQVTRDSVGNWLSTHAGNFSRIIDFHAVVNDDEIPWGSKDNEIDFDMISFPDEY